MDQKADKIINLNHAETIYFNGPVVINTNDKIPLSSLLPSVEHIADKEEKTKPLSSNIPLRPLDEQPYHPSVHDEGDLLHGLVFKLTIPECPLNYKGNPSLEPNSLGEILLSYTEGRKIHSHYITHRTITGAINQEDLRWDWKRDRPETLYKLLNGYLFDLFSFCTTESQAIKFRIYCSFAIGDYTVKDGLICGETYSTVSEIHNGMERLFTPLSTDYKQVYEYETEEFKESRTRYYYTCHSEKDYLDEGIIIGTTDLEYIGGYSSWCQPILCNEYGNSKAVIMYTKRDMPGYPHGFLQKVKRSIAGFGGVYDD